MAATALEHFCGSVFWNSSFLDNDDADLPLCFEQTVLVWIPLGFLWLFGPWKLLPMCKSKLKKSSLTKLYLMKQVLTLLLLLVALTEVVFTIVEDSGKYPAFNNGRPAVQYTNPVLYSITWILVLLIHDSCRFTVCRDSGVLFLFFTLSLTSGIFQLQTLIRQAVQGSITDVPRFSFFLGSYGLQLLLLSVSVISDIAPEMKEAAKKNPEITASFLSSITYHWYNSMLVKGYRTPLENEDLWDLRDSEKTQHVFCTFEKRMKAGVRKAQRKLEIWHRKRKQRLAGTDLTNGLSKAQSQDALVLEEKEKKTKKMAIAGEQSKNHHAKNWLIVALFQSCAGKLLKSVALKLIHDFLVFANPQLLKMIINFVSDPKAYLWQGIVFAVLLLVTALVQSLCLQQYFQLCFEVGMNLRTSLLAAIYKKALTISNVARKESTVGETVNLMSVDAQRFMDFTLYMHQLWSSPLQIIISLVFLWTELGPSVLAGIAVMVLLIPLNAVLVNKSRNIQVTLDARGNMAAKSAALASLYEKQQIRENLASEIELERGQGMIKLLRGLMLATAWSDITLEGCCVRKTPPLPGGGGATRELLGNAATQLAIQLASEGTFQLASEGILERSERLERLEVSGDQGTNDSFWGPDTGSRLERTGSGLET